MQVQPYLFFDGRCEEAVEFYRKAIGAEVVMMMRYKDAPQKPPPGAVAPGGDDKVMHASFRVGETEVMASDGREFKNAPAFQGFSLSIRADDDAHARRLFDALADGGRAMMPLGKTFFASSFGMVADRFGVHWMVIASNG